MHSIVIMVAHSEVVVILTLISLETLKIMWNFEIMADMYLLYRYPGDLDFNDKLLILKFKGQKFFLCWKNRKIDHSGSIF